jgi:hypothetical protein
VGEEEKVMRIWYFILQIFFCVAGIIALVSGSDQALACFAFSMACAGLHDIAVLKEKNNLID